MGHVGVCCSSKILFCETVDKGISVSRVARARWSLPPTLPSSRLVRFSSFTIRQNSLKVTRERAGEGGREGFNRSPIPKVPDTSCHPDPDSLLSSPGEERAPISISWQTYVTLRLLLGYLERETLLPTCSSGLHTWREREYIKARIPEPVYLPFRFSCR